MASSADPRFLWNEIVRWTFEACVLRKEGREGPLKGLMEQRLPALIKAWSRRSGLEPEACRERLRGLFARAQETVEFGLIQRRLIVEEVCARLGQAAAPLLADVSGKVGLRRRVKIDDVSGMLDALAEAEFERMGEAVLPLRRSLSVPPELLSGESAQVALCA